MFKQLFEHSPLTSFSVIALVLFFAVFVTVVIRTFAKKASAYDATAALPLQDDTVRHGGP